MDPSPLYPGGRGRAAATAGIAAGDQSAPARRLEEDGWVHPRRPFSPRQKVPSAAFSGQAFIEESMPKALCGAAVTQRFVARQRLRLGGAARLRAKCLSAGAG